MAGKAQQGRRPWWALGPIAAVRRGEGATVLLLGLSLFVLLFAYYLLKNVREVLILGNPRGGAELKMYATGAQAVVLAFLSFAFGALASRSDRMRLLTATTLFFVAALVVFFGLFLVWPSRRLELGVAFYIWLGCFNTSSVAALWGFASDIYPRERGERLFPLVAAGGAIGALVGSVLAAPLYRHIGLYPILLVAAVLLLGLLGVTRAVHAREAAYGVGDARRSRDEVIGRDGGFSLARGDVYLALLLALSFIKSWVNSGGEYILDRELVGAAQRAAFESGAGHAAVQSYIAVFKAHYLSAYNLVVVVLQLFLVGRILRYAGVGGALLISPLVALLGYGWAEAQPILGVLLVVKIGENGVDYSLQKTAEQALYLVTSRRVKYKLKMAIDTFVVRAGDVMAALVVWVGTSLALRTVQFVLINILLTGGWIAVVLALMRAHRRRTGVVPQPPSVSPGSGMRMASETLATGPARRSIADRIASPVPAK